MRSIKGETETFMHSFASVSSSLQHHFLKFLASLHRIGLFWSRSNFRHNSPRILRLIRVKMRSSFSTQSTESNITNKLLLTGLRDLSSLQDNKWIAETIINDWAKYLIHQQNAYDSILYVPTFLFCGLLDSVLRPQKTSKLVKYLGNNKALTKDIILVGIPTTTTGKHWMLGVIMLNTKRISILDPKQTLEDDFISHDIFNNLLRITLAAHKLADTEFDPNQWELFYARAIPRQYNKNDCGVCVCHYIYRIVTGQHMIEDLTEDALHEGRSRIHCTLSQAKEIKVPSTPERFYSTSIIKSLTDSINQVFEIKILIKTFWHINEHSIRSPKYPIGGDCADLLCSHFLTNVEVDQSFCCKCRCWYHNDCVTIDSTANYPICSNCLSVFPSSIDLL